MLNFQDNGSIQVRKVCFNNLYKEMLWKSKMKIEVKCDVYFDMLLMVFICVIEYELLRDDMDIQKPEA